MRVGLKGIDMLAKKIRALKNRSSGPMATRPVSRAASSVAKKLVLSAPQVHKTTAIQDVSERQDYNEERTLFADSIIQNTAIQYNIVHRSLGASSYQPYYYKTINGGLFTSLAEVEFYRNRVFRAETVPDPPTDVVGTSGNGQISVAFTTPANNGGTAITGYTATSSPGGFTATGSSSPLVISGLTNGTSYTFTVVATNSEGDSAPSVASGAVVPSTVPDAPTSVSATGGNAQASVSFTAPASNGGAAITEYTATSSPGGFTATGSSSPLVVSGLTNGTAYTFTVVATNIKGNSVASSASSSITPSTVPSAPTSVSASAGNAQATITFTASSSNGGATITGYTATSSPGGLTATGSGSPLTITGLTNGTSYTFTVVATNSNGNSAASTASSAVVPSTVPGAPTSVSAVAGNTQATVSFTAPVSNGGSAITGYTATSNPGGFTATGASSPLTITGLTNGTSYTFTVVATNANGNSSSSSASSAITPAIGGDVSVLLLGSSSDITTIRSSILTAKTELQLSGTLTITNQALNGYTGTDLASYDVVFFTSNGGVSLPSALGTNLNNYVAGGGHLIMAAFSWGNVSAIPNFTYSSYSTFPYTGSMSLINGNDITHIVTHPITTGVGETTGSSSVNVQSPGTITAGSTTISRFDAGAGTIPFIVIKTVGSARLVGFNIYVNGGNSNLRGFLCNAIYWCVGLLE